MILNYLRLTRPLNLAMIALFMWVLYRFIVFEIYGPSINLWDAGEYIAMEGFSVRVAPLEGDSVWLLIIATILIAAAGNVINDYYDIEADKINKPDKLIISNKISKKAALIFFALLATFGATLGLCSAFLASAMQFAMVFPIALILLWGYARFFQKWFLVGNVVVSLLSGLVPMLIWMFTCVHPIKARYSAWDNDYTLTNGYFLKIFGILALLAFLGTLLREIIKDLADVEGDKLVGSHTLPIVLGANPTKWIVSILTLGTLTFLFAAYSSHNSWIMLSYLTTFIGAPLVAAVAVLWAFEKRSKHLLASNLIKVSMLFVMLLPIVHHYIYPNQF